MKERTTFMMPKAKKEKFEVKGEELMKKVKEIIEEGNARRVVIKNDKGETYLEIPINIGILSAVFAPILIAVGAIAAIASKFTIEVTKVDKKPAKKSAKKKTKK